ncbi:hypothetical protein PPUJ13061_50730 [Pseudomonas putida]|nr:hypothetical protein PPUJ13061_50730 [Pseudomonas putida]
MLRRGRDSKMNFHLLHRPLRSARLLLQGGEVSQVFFTLNHAAYNAGRNNRVNAVATIKPPMIATAIGP